MNVRLCLLAFTLLCAVRAEAQSIAQEVPADTLTKYSYYDLDRLPPSFHAGRRAKLLDMLPARSVAYFTAAPERTRSNDVQYEYHQNVNLYYLTGCLEPSSALMLIKDGLKLEDGRTVHEILFVQPRDPARETWTGKRLGVDGAKQILRVEAVFTVDTFSKVLAKAVAQADTVLYSRDEESVWNPLTDSTIRTGAIVAAQNQTLFPAVHWKSPDGYLAKMRMVKTDAELVQMRKAIDISCLAHNEAMRQSRAGWHEYEIQALAEYTFTKNGAQYTGYPCIVGSGPNSTILHYETNRRAIKHGDFIEMDMGAEYNGYSADVTRSFPIDGKFTDAQRTIYELVLEAQDSGIKACVAGAPFNAAHSVAVRVIRAGLVRLGIITDSNDYRKYFMHGTSHYLGLDVHDAGTRGRLEPGVVLTVEPGVYIAEGSPCDKKWWNIGCRIEDDILVSATGPVNLSAASPRTVADVERLMQGRQSP